MALSFAHGSVQWLTSQGVGTTIVVSGLGFQPRAIRFYWTGIQSNSPTNAVSGANDMRAGIGFAVSTTSRRAVGIFDDDGLATPSNSGSIAVNNAVVATIDGAGTVTGLLDISAIGVDGFTLIVDDTAPVNLTINYEAWGGDDITVAVIGDIAEPAATGTVNYTVNGFTSDGVDQVVMFAGTQSTAALNTGANTDAGLTVGFASSTSTANQVVIVGNSDDASDPTDTDGYSYEGQCLAMIPVGGGGTINASATLSAWGTNQFTLNWAARTTTNRRYIFLAIKGGKWRAGSLTINSSAVNNTASVTGLPFTLQGISFFSRDTAISTVNTTTADSILLFGTASGTASRRALGVNSDNGVDPTVVNTIIRYDACLAAPTFGGAVNTLYDISVFGTDNFTVIVDDAGTVTNVRQYYLAFGDIPVSPTPTPTVTQTRTPTLTPTPTVTPTQGGGGGDCISYLGFTESTTTTITLPSGLQEGDMVIIIGGSDGTAQNLPTDYTNGQNGNNGVQYRWSYKFMGPIPDTVATGLAGTSIAMAFAFRGVEIVEPFDVTPPAVSTDGGSVTGMPDPPSITSVNNDCVILALGWLDDDVVAASVTAPSTFTLIDAAQYGTAGAGATIMAAFLQQGTAGTINPGAFGGTGSDAWVGASVALRCNTVPDPSPTPTPTLTPTRTVTPTITPSTTLTPTPSETPGLCKVTQIGSPTISTTTTITLPTGLQENDIVIVASMSDGTTQLTPTTFTSGQLGVSNTVQYQWSYKIMGATPDTEATGLAATSIAIAFAYRNVDTTTPLDVAAPTISTAGAGMPNPPAITTVTARDMIVKLGFLDDDLVASSVTAPPDLSLVIAAEYGTAGNGGTIMAAQIIQNTAGLFDTGVFGGTGDDAWVGATFALRFFCNENVTPTPTPTQTPTPTSSPAPIPGGVVTDGLVCYLDPGNTTSYPGTGTNFNDLSYANNDGTIVGSPIYIPFTFSGTFYFDQTVAQYIDLGTPASLNTGLQSYQVWVRAKTPQDELNNQLISRTNTNAGTFNLLKRNTTLWGANLRTAANPATQTNIDTILSANTNWINIALTYDGTDLKIYEDGLERSTTTVSGLIDTATFGGINIMRNTTGAAYYQGSLGVVLIYNKGLSAAEITQNYNAFKQRYIVHPQFQTVGHPFIF